MKNNLVIQILFAFVLAIVLGAIVGPDLEIVQPLGDLFLRLIQFIIVPLVLSSLVVGVASTGNLKELGQLSFKTVSYYMVTTAIAISIGLFFGTLFSPGTGVDIDVSSNPSVEAQETPGIKDTLLNIVPTNPIAALTDGNMLQIIFFAIFLGIGITMVGEKARPLYQLFEQLAEVMYKITGVVMRFAPIGIFGLIAPTVGEYGLAVLWPLLKVILALLIGSLVHVLIVYSLSVKYLGKMSPIVFFKNIMPVAMVAFSTSSSSGTLPMTIKYTEEQLKVPRKISSFVLPLGATINMNGTALYQGVCVLFVAQYFGMNLTFVDQLTVVLTATLASIGTAGVPSAGLIMLSMVMTSIGLPLEGIALLAGIDRILDMIRTSVNVLGDASAAVVVSSKERNQTEPENQEEEYAAVHYG
ncbi:MULTISPECIES: dicarboxylate/amino acid:cation symporter [Pontibacillus]|uniref:Dicarboxylate/amino acid:cation symporter n=1 Tax=Pontibacillus chungwhensis TaxID=265426 RepID=A0ABY8V1F0_9BACI|nr:MULTISPECIES: dicarboxylate/amino acid:cation symporter [Pontibacillus]MCD5325986.1 dicarboxylate/amino acid:cation symporter [Pontibacillus sp. HN14]WIF98440.1 dicarboxylate/amino acid:cation symporter [Pontibacillus chungwhensis]